MRRGSLIAFAVLLSACGGAGMDATAAPAIDEVAPAEVAIAEFAPVAEGSGLITFGVEFDPETLEIPRAVTRFRRNYPQIAWSANLSRAVDASSLTWLVVRRFGTGVEDPRFSADEPTDQAGVRVLANSGDLAGLLDHAPGTYVMRYFDATELVAEGTFTLVK